MSDQKRETARAIALRHLEAGDALGWFEDLYSQAGGDPRTIPWADLAPNPSLIEWLDTQGPSLVGRALKVGCGLGDDAEELARRGLETTAFDISATAIEWARRRSPSSPVSYITADLLSAPIEWQGRFNLVVESYTLQVLPPALRAEAMRRVAAFVAPGGSLLVIARAREPSDPEGKMPWPLTKAELSRFTTYELELRTFEDFLDKEAPPVRRFRASYRRARAVAVDTPPEIG